MKKNYILLMNLIFASLIIIFDVIYISGLVPNKYIIKTTTSALFVLCGTFNFIVIAISKNPITKKSILLLLGLFFAFLGDVLLIEHFVIGAGLFAIGHIFFLSYFISLYKITWIDIAIGATIFICSMLLIILYPYFNFNGMLILIIVYALIISCMLGKAIGTVIKNNNKANLVMAIGAFLFFFSDLMLLFNVFTDLPRIFDILCLATYYPAEFLLAITICLQSRYERNKESLS